VTPVQHCNRRRPSVVAGVCGVGGVRSRPSAAGPFSPSRHCLIMLRRRILGTEKAIHHRPPLEAIKTSRRCEFLDVSSPSTCFDVLRPQSCSIEGEPVALEKSIVWKDVYSVLVAGSASRVQAPVGAQPRRVSLAPHAPCSSMD